MADLLSAYLAEAGRRGWAWGELDCFLFCADWVERITGIDPAGEYRGAYTTSREAHRLILAKGGAIAFVGELLARADLIETPSPCTGDVALATVEYIRDRKIHVPVGAICVRPDLWAIKPADGRSLAVVRLPVLKAWSLNVARSRPTRR